MNDTGEKRVTTRQARKANIKRFSAMTRKEKVFRIVNISVAVALSVSCFIYMLVLLISGNDPLNRKMTTLGMTALCLVPLLIEWIFAVRFSNMLFLFFNLFVFVAGYTGSVLYVYEWWPPYDTIVHGVFGYVGGILGLLIICKLSDYSQQKTFFILAVCFFVSMGCGAVWECFEFFADNVLGQTSQGVKVIEENGRMVASLTDTVQDLYANLVGILIFTAHMLIHRLTKRKLLIGAVVDDFTGDNADEPAA